MRLGQRGRGLLDIWVRKGMTNVGVHQDKLSNKLVRQVKHKPDGFYISFYFANRGALSRHLLSRHLTQILNEDLKGYPNFQLLMKGSQHFHKARDFC